MAVKAKESPHVLKARKKLKHQLHQEDKHINSQALDKIRKSIHYWIERHAPERVVLKSKIKTFDENRHSAKPQNKFVVHLLRNLKSSKPGKPLENLAGRVKAH